jgi:hypothetical protein
MTYLEAEAPFRFILGAIFIFLLPGLIWNQVFRIRANHILETIALSLATSLAVEISLIPIPFLFHEGVWLWLALISAFCIAGLALLTLKRQRLALPSWDLNSILFLIVLAGLSLLTYRWGESIESIDGEKILHMTYIRYYFSMPMELSRLAVIPGQPPANLIHLWEFLIAGWATVCRVDPLFLFSRCRFVVPFLGLSSMFFMVKMIFKDRERSEVVFWSILAMCLGWFVLLPPSNLGWITQNDPLRGIFSFMGTTHHSDSGMEILISLDVGLVLLCLREPRWRHLAILAGTLVATFMWHAREFFQVGIYLGVFCLALLLHKSGKMRNGLVMVACIFCLVSAFFYIASPVRNHSDEMGFKVAALAYAVRGMFDVQEPFHFANDVRLTYGLSREETVPYEQLVQTRRNSWNFYPWLILSVLLVPVLSIFGDREDRMLCTFYVLLWFMSLMWFFGQMMMIVLTYSEILFTAPRMLYLFSYVIIGSGIWCMAKMKYGPLLVIGAGLMFGGWWALGVPGARQFSLIAPILMAVPFARRIRWKIIGNN